MKNIEELKEENNTVNILGLDISSTCTGYAVLTCNFVTRKAEVTSAGAIWLDPNVDNAVKYNYMARCITEYFYVLGYIDYLVYEQYTVNMNQRTGMLVTPEMIGAIKSAIADVGIAYDSIVPQTWRSMIGVKPVITELKGEKKKDFKTPVKKWVNNIVKIPDTMMSNITGIERNTPSDLFDAIGVIIGWGSKLTGANGTPYFKVVTISKDIQLNPHLGFNLGEK